MEDVRYEKKSAVMSTAEEAADVLRRKKLFLLDMDGTLYIDDSLFEGAVEFLQAVKDVGGKYLFLTNNSSKGVESYIEKLKLMGIHAERKDFLTSVDAAVHVLRDKFGATFRDTMVYVMGTKSFKKQLRDAGFTICDEETYDAEDAAGKSIDCVLLGFDRELTYRKLEQVCRILSQSDPEYFATNPDWVCPVSFGSVPDCGSMAWMIEKATGKAPDFIGKPQPAMVNLAMERSGFSKEETVLIGDRLYTDIACGNNAGVDTVFVLSGEGTLEDLNEEEPKGRPTLVMEGIWSVGAALAYKK